MKLDEVFVGFDKNNNKEHLLYKLNDELFYDLNSNEKYKVKDIDLSTLIYLRDTLFKMQSYLKDDMLKSHIKKLYNQDRKKLIDVNSLLIVDIKQVTDYEKRQNQYKWNSMFLYKMLLKQYIPNCYEDLRTNKLYLGEIPKMLSNGSVYVDDGTDNNMKSIKEYYPNLGSLEKKKVLELAYKISKE